MELDARKVALERLGVKTFCAATALQELVITCTRLKRLEHKIHRYVHQVSLLVTWKRSSAATKMVGSAAKTIGTVVMLAAPLHPKLGLISKIGHHLWKLGTGLKILNTIACIIKDLWQNGCRNTLLEFTHCAALMTRNITTFQEIVTDLQSSVGEANRSSNGSFQTVDILFQGLKQFIPGHLHRYAFHTISLVFGKETYSPLFDFVALSANLQNESYMIQLARELEGFHFTEFIHGSDSKSLVAIGSFLHVSRELLDFLDGFQRLTDKDCHFLQDCLLKFVNESEKIIKVVSFLTALEKVNTAKNVKNESGNAQQVQSCDESPHPHLVLSPEENQKMQYHNEESSKEKAVCAVESTPSAIIIQDFSEDEDPVSPAHLVNEEESPDCDTSNDSVVIRVGTSEAYSPKSLIFRACSSVSAFVKIKTSSSVVGSVSTKVHSLKNPSTEETETQFDSVQADVNRI